MATKTITIDIEAYGRLKTVQRENESFSQTIKRVVPKPIPTGELIAMFRGAGAELSESFFRGVETAMEARKLTGDEERIHGLLGHDGRSRSHGPRRTTKASRSRGKAKAA
jgi:predicted CopG family antitoxin